MDKGKLASILFYLAAALNLSAAVAGFLTGGKLSPILNCIAALLFAIAGTEELIRYYRRKKK